VQPLKVLPSKTNGNKHFFPDFVRQTSTDDDTIEKIITPLMNNLSILLYKSQKTKPKENKHLFSDFVRQISPDDDTIEKIITPLLRH
jgi:transcription termination factor NusB